MKNFKGKKLVCFALAALMTATLFAGCAKTPTTSSTTASGTESSAAGSTSTKYKEPITLTWQSSTTDDYPLDGDGMKAMVKKIAEATNVTIEWKLVPSADANTVYTTTIAAGQKQWPNLMTKDLGTINDDGVRGAYVDLTPVLKEKMPNVYEKLNAYDRWADMMDLDSASIYGVPRVDQQVCKKSWMIRKDWLDICGLKEPTTVEEFADCLRAFKEKNPGNAPDGSNVPFICRGNPQDWISFSFGSFGMDTVYYTEHEDGTIDVNLCMDEFRECLKYWHQLYTEGLVDREADVGDSNRWTTYMNNSYSGATIDYTVRTQQFTNAAQNPSDDALAVGIKANPDAALIGLSPLTAAGRTTATVEGNDPLNTNLSVGIMSSCTEEQREAAMCLINYIYSEEGSKLLSWGEDGVTYNGVDSEGTPNWIDDLKNNYSIKTTSKYGIQPSIARPLTPQEIVMVFPGLAKEAYDKNEGHYEKRHSAMYLSDEDWTTHGDIMAELATFYVESVTQFLVGDRTLDDAGWQQFQDELKNSYQIDTFKELTEKGIKQAKDMTTEFKL